MIQLYNLDQAEAWDNVVYSFKCFDIYYLCGYVRAFRIHGDGDPHLLFYDNEGLRAIYVFMKRRTIIDGYYDSVTPYGYGGVLFEGDITEKKIRVFWKVYVEKMLEEGIVDNFVRYHPVLANAAFMTMTSNVIDLGRTIAMDISSEQTIWNNMTSKNRNMIRKAEKNGIEIFHGRGMELFKVFERIYNATMDKDHADEYYYFGDAFYESIHRDLHENYEIFYAVMDKQIIAMSIILFANQQVHYHLSGSLMEYRHLAPSNLLLYKVALWGCEQGYKIFHLGGGVGSGEDNLYKFKAAFNRNANYQFSIGKEIFDQDKYDELVNMRNRVIHNFNSESSFFPLYRSK
jgi:hypothetical protein